MSIYHKLCFEIYTLYTEVEVSSITHVTKWMNEKTKIN